MKQTALLHAGRGGRNDVPPTRDRKPRKSAASLRDLLKKNILTKEAREFDCLGGPLAHLVERRVCNAEVTGSSPVGSTQAVAATRRPARHPPDTLRVVEAGGSAAPSGAGRRVTTPTLKKVELEGSAMKNNLCFFTYSKFRRFRIHHVTNNLLDMSLEIMIQILNNKTASLNRKGGNR